MKSALKRALLILLMLAILSPSSVFAAPSPKADLVKQAPQAASVTDDGENASESLPKKNKTVVLILAPYLTWGDITSEKTPKLMKAAQEGAAGNINARSRVKDELGEPSLTEGALTLSAGAWAKVDNRAFGAYNVTEFFERGDAGSAYTRMIGQPLNDDQIVYLGLPRTIAANESNSFTFTPGILGETVRAAGGLTAAFGNSDLGYSDEAQRTMRPSALVAMDTKGRVMRGTISEKMLHRDPDSPYGVRSNLETLAEELTTLKADVMKAPTSLITVDPGDLYRARTYSANISPDVAEEHWDDALRTLDDTYALTQEIYPDATIIVTAQAALELGASLEGFGPLIFSDLKPGVLTSSSTKRAGLVTNLDLSSSILDILSLEQPLEVLGQPIVSTGDFSLRLVGISENTAENRIDLLRKMNATALSVESNRYNILNTFIFSIVFILAMGAFVIIRSKHWSEKMMSTVRRLIKLGIILVLSFPAASWLMFLLFRWPATQQQALIQFLLALFGLFVLNIVIAWRFNKTAPLIFLSVVTSVIIVVDQLLGAPASFTSFFGYSPIQAFRFYGIGNEGAAVLFGAAIIAIALSLDYWRDSHWITLFKRYGILIIGFIVTFVSAAPNLGANVGVALWSTVGFMGFFFLANDKKITPKRVLLIALVVAVMLGSIIAIDRFSESGTHLARSIESTEQGGIGQFLEIVLRKIETNIRVLTATNLVFLLIAVIIFLAVMRWRPTKDFKYTLDRNPAFSDSMTTILITGAVAYLSEDSGIVLPALMVLYLGNSIVWLMLDNLGMATRLEPECSTGEGT